MAPSAVEEPVAAAAAPAATSPAAVATDNLPRILVPEKVSPDGLAMLQDHCQVDIRLGLSAEELLQTIPSYNGLIVRSETKVTAAVLAAGRKLRVVARAGVGVDNIDVDAATTHGIIVVNSPAGNIRAAAEHTVALLLATARNIGRADTTMKEGKWARSSLVGVEVGGKVLGIVGLGKVGMQVARMAKGLGMRVVAYDPYASPEVARSAGVELVANTAGAPGNEKSGLDALLPQVDFLTIHTPLLATTLNLLDETQFKAMKPAARVLNVARGGVYNEEALVKALDNGWIAGAGIDVFTSEPVKPDPEGKSWAARLAAHPKVVATPHLGASTVEAQENVSLDVCAQMRTILRGGLPTAAVNAPLILPEEYRKLQPYVRLVERMGSLYTQHFSRASRPGSLSGSRRPRRRFELVYRGELADVANTRPLFAALVKGLVSSVTDAGGRDVNIVNATLIAKEKGLAIRETHDRSEGGSGVSLRAQADDEPEASTSATPSGEEDGPALAPVDDAPAAAAPVAAPAAATTLPDEIIEGYVSGKSIYISRVDRFVANFVPEGTLLVLHNYDEPGKIGHVGMALGRHGINITFMHVASVDRSGAVRRRSVTTGTENEALMILGVDGPAVTPAVIDDLRESEGILDVSLVRL
ncbi:phosphoglycerate dehydrogenase [Sporothrix schenckii ATCC 58251]|uniref:Phosphoglycerate dehydrogenase n=1 Tax=Sporothrix schenckii (strain ATCC 58251 / de Perez 2211183) TaxID=1391915 RepID=U7PWC7_SPOS1|nr:phosphoglycerate dehydrogenase [Sporothrix schenckii ATCC 58251]